LAPAYTGAVLLIVGTVRLPPENLSRAKPAMAKMVQSSRQEEGCLVYAYAEDILEPGLIHVNELWADQAALDRHFASEHIREWRSTWPSLGIGERNLHAFEVGEPRST
jgi:quinol monooxygenase YgiN